MNVGVGGDTIQQPLKYHWWLDIKAVYTAGRSDPIRFVANVQIGSGSDQIWPHYWPIIAITMTLKQRCRPVSICFAKIRFHVISDCLDDERANQFQSREAKNQIFGRQSGLRGRVYLHNFSLLSFLVKKHRHRKVMTGSGESCQTTGCYDNCSDSVHWLCLLRFITDLHRAWLTDDLHHTEPQLPFQHAQRGTQSFPAIAHQLQVLLGVVREGQPHFPIILSRHVEGSAGRRQ